MAMCDFYEWYISFCYVHENNMMLINSGIFLILRCRFLILLVEY